MRIESWASRHPEVHEHRPKNAALDRPADDFLAELKGILDAQHAQESGFVQAVARGEASLEELRVFARDLIVLAREIPLIEGLIAAQGTWHSPALVTMLSSGQALGAGYAGFAPLEDLAKRFSAALGIPERREHDTSDGDPFSPLKAYLLVLTEMADGGLEIGVAATAVDEQWAAVAEALEKGCRRHYRVSDADLEVFQALSAFDDPRTKSRWRLLAELAQGGFHRYAIRRSVQETAATWRNMWNSWSSRDAKLGGAA